MASENRSTTPALDLRARQGADYNFFQALRVLRSGFATRAQFESAVRFQANLSLAFPRSDIERIDVDEAGKIRIVANFFGLYGVASPLPTFYTEDLIDESRSGGRAMRDVIDIVHNVLYPMLFQAWEKNRLWLAAGEQDDMRRRDLLMALVGRMGHVPDPADDVLRLRFAGLTSHRPGSALALRTLVRGLTGLRDVRVETCVQNDAAVPANAHCLLGVARLGATLVGTQVARRSGVVDIYLSGFGTVDLAALLPGGALWRRLMAQLRSFLDAPLVCRLLLTSRADAGCALELGVRDAGRLGMNTWLGGARPGAPLETVTLTLFGADAARSFDQGDFA
ncbi:type VI secretion system baseplate subunit TssG [Paraburkholderia sediminicola]|uniref:type VI secretion system baseplate subunit TssG n=1 Tax=Paraburkholderia sediminicola TaxID=458836 RepID=UPI0038B96EFB